MSRPLREWEWNGSRAATPDDLAVPELLDASEFLLERNVARGLGEAVAIREDDGGVLTYGQLQNLVLEIAARLPWPRDSRVVVHLGHSVEFIVCALALFRAGLVLVPVPSTADLGETLEIMEDAEPVAVLTHRARDLASEVGSTCDVIDIGWDGPMSERLGAVLVRERRRDTVQRRHRTDEAYWLYTSGTSGRPKAARHRHQDVICAAIMWAGNVLALGRSEKCLSLSPVTHSFGLAAGFFFPLWAGAEVVVVRATHHRAIWRAICDQGVARLFGVPRHFMNLLDKSTRDNHRIRSAYSSGENLPPELQQSFIDAVGVPLLDAMGSSETFTNPISSTGSDWRPGSSGRVIPGVRARLVSEGTEVVGAGVGVLEVESPANAFGYWNRPSASSQTFRGGRCDTGDVFERDADGFLYFRGRGSSRFKVFGEFVDPLSLESAARRVPGVKDVVAFQVAGRAGVAACGMAVVLNPGADGRGVADAVRSEVMGGVGTHAVPHIVVAVAGFPTTHSGKLRRAAIEEYARENGRPL